MNQINNFDSSQYFMGLNAQHRAVVIVERLLEESEINLMK